MTLREKMPEGNHVVTIDLSDVKELDEKLLRHWATLTGTNLYAVVRRVGETWVAQNPEHIPEPMRFGTRITATYGNGAVGEYLRVAGNSNFPWMAAEGSRFSWEELTASGSKVTITEGWDD